MSQEAATVAWDRGEAGLCSIHDIANRYSVQHVALPSSRDHTLCGSRIPWLYLTSGDSRRCNRCFGLAARRGYVDEWGEPFEARLGLSVAHPNKEDS